MEIKRYVKNSKIHTEEQLEALAKIVAEIGWRQPVEVNKNGYIIVGHARFKTWEKYKDEYKLPEVWVVDNTGKTIMGEHDTRPLTKEQENMWRIADNRISEIGSSWDYDLVKEEFSELDEEFKKLTGFDEDTLFGNFDTEDEWEDMPEFDHSDIKNYKTVLLHFKTEEDMQEFSELINQKITTDTKFIYYPKQEREIYEDKRYES